jgi:hypothetical protein
MITKNERSGVESYKRPLSAVYSKTGGYNFNAENINYM